MKTNLLLLLTLCLCSMFISCDDQMQSDAADIYYKMLKEKINSEYDSLPELKPIKDWNEVESCSNFKIRNNKIWYDGEAILDSRGVKPLYCQGDVLVLLDGELLVVLYKTEITPDPMKYNSPTMIGGKIKDNVAYVKLQDAKDGRIILIKYVSEVGKMSNVYVCNY
ncbi:MAG: hypothetical protein ACOYL8_02390 [Patescibacteria group bacterium]